MYLSKCGIITFIKSFVDLTVKYTALSFFLIEIFPIPLKKCCIFSIKAASLSCKETVNTGIIFQPVLYPGLLSTKIEKQPSPSTNPVT